LQVKAPVVAMRVRVADLQLVVVQDDAHGFWVLSSNGLIVQFFFCGLTLKPLGHIMSHPTFTRPLLRFSLI